MKCIVKCLALGLILGMVGILGSCNGGNPGAVQDAARDGVAVAAGKHELPRYPAGFLDLRAFKLTLPNVVKGKPQEILQPVLGTFSDAEYFHLTADGSGIVFRAPCGGATTKNTNYPRCELREMNPDATPAAWSTERGEHRMVIRQAITHLPVAKPEVVAGQIHDAKDDVATIRLEGTHLFVDHNGKQGATLTKNYALGTVFTVEFQIQNGRIKIFYNREKKPADEFSIATDGCYFKAGCYTQSNVMRGDRADAYAEVVIYELNVSHNDSEK